MANKQIFKSMIGKLLPKADAVNHENAPAYCFSDNHVLAQYAATGCFYSTFYASGVDQTNTLIELSRKVDPGFVARTAIYCRERGFMKDSPALLCAVLSTRDRDLFVATFRRVIDSGKMLRNFVQIMRSGAVGRKSLGTLPKRMVKEWFDGRSDDLVFKASVGQSPSMADVIKMVHPKPGNSGRQALYAHLIGREASPEALPALVREFEEFKSGVCATIPDVPFQMLTALDLAPEHWMAIARNGSWQMTRMNLNTFARHGVFSEPGLTELIAARLRDPEAIASARAFPYQLLAASTSLAEGIPVQVREALADAMELAISNVPKVPGKVVVCPDVSGSMASPVTGRRKGATSVVRCIDVAALMAAAVLRGNSTATVIPFATGTVAITLDPNAPVMGNARKLAAIGGGGTNCSAPLALLNQQKAKGDLVIYVSDNESWVDAAKGRGTETMREWKVFKRRNPRAKLVCIDVQPYATTQACEREDTLNVGGFSDQVFEVVTEFASDRLSANHWIDVIESVTV
ncbi:MAG TPA: RNA-binding protein [Blastocatellia bacterium]|nr:RNA-binding protein [Blastocatellia bacterium]